MKFTPTPLEGAYVVEIEPIADERGFFARLFCKTLFAKHGLDPHLEQISLSHNSRAGILRGLHLQRPPFAETKLVRVTRGAIYDVIVDVRAGSRTFGGWYAVELSEANRKQLYIPHGFAHGFQTLTDTADVTYHMSVPFHGEAQDGIRWNDPALSISWPNPERAIVSERDARLGLLASFQPIVC